MMCRIKVLRISKTFFDIMETFMPISYLNDFVFCPYSIYLHQVFDGNQEEVYSASPQQKGKSGHDKVDNAPKYSRTVLNAIYVISNKLGMYGKIDQYFVKEKLLVERKYSISTLYRGYYYQIWTQYLAMKEMGYGVEKLQFYSMKDNRRYEIPLPSDSDVAELKAHIRKIARFDFENDKINVNPTKCAHCIYAALCDKTDNDHVYS